MSHRPLGIFCPSLVDALPFTTLFLHPRPQEAKKFVFICGWSVIRLDLWFTMTVKSNSKANIDIWRGLQYYLQKKSFLKFSNITPHGDCIFCVLQRALNSNCSLWDLLITTTQCVFDWIDRANKGTNMDGRSDASHWGRSHSMLWLAGSLMEIWSRQSMSRTAYITLWVTEKGAGSFLISASDMSRLRK